MKVEELLAEIERLQSELHASLEHYPKWTAESDKRINELAAERDRLAEDCEFLRQAEAASQKRRFELAAENERLREEVQCLRSVLSEWDFDKSCFLQWLRAEEIRAEKNAKMEGE